MKVEQTMKIYMESIKDVAGIAVDTVKLIGEEVDTQLVRFARWAGNKALELTEPYEGDYGPKDEEDTPLF